MRAAVIREHGGLERVRVEEISEPKFADAMGKMEAAEQFGKIVLEVSR